MKYIKVIIIYIVVLLSLSIDCKESIDDDSSNSNGISQDLLMDGIFQCANTIKRTCQLNTKPKMNETLSCLQNNFHELQKDCMKVFNGLLKDVLASCGYDLLTTCQAEAATLSPAEGVSCLFKHYSIVSSSCRAQLDLLASYAVPCGTEAATYCSDKNNPQDIFDCLSTIRKFNATSIFDPVCSNVILGYQNCLPKSNAENIISNHDDNPFRNQKIISFNDDSESNSEYDYSDNSIPGEANTPSTDDVYVYDDVYSDKSIPGEANAPSMDDAYMEDDIEYSDSAYATSEDDDTYDDSNESTWFGGGNGDDYDDDYSVVDDLGSRGSDDYGNDDDYGYTSNRQQPKSKPKPKPKAKPKPKTGGGNSGGGGGSGGKSKPHKSPGSRLQEKPQKPSMIKISELKVDKISSANRNLQSGGGSKPKPKAKPGPGKGGDGNQGANDAPPFLPPPSNGKPCWAVDDQVLSQGKIGSNKNDDTVSNGDSRGVERGGLIAFIGFVFSLTILGALTYLWCKNGRSFSNLTVQRAAEIVSEKDPYESGYAPTAADDHDDEGPSDRMLQEPDIDSGSIEMSDLKISSTVPSGYAKLTINEENV